jgi:hypothetical protein
MVKALARAFRWRKQLDEGVHTTIEDLAKSNGIGKTYVSQVLRLTLSRLKASGWRSKLTQFDAVPTIDRPP